MTTNHTDDELVADALDILDRRVSEAADDARALLEHIEKSRADQPERLAKARADADEARGWALIEEPFDGQVTTIAGHNEYGGERSLLSLPNMTAKELFGTRLCFDMIDCGDDWDRVDTVLNRYFSMANGDTGILFLLLASALSTVATLIVPQMLEEIEQQASNYDVRVMLAEARAKAWHGRVSELREAQDDAADCGVKPVDGYDIGANALDLEEPAE